MDRATKRALRDAERRTKRRKKKLAEAARAACSSLSCRAPTSSRSARARPSIPYTRPKLRARIVERVKAGSKGGKPGQWSARKAQIVAGEYEAAGGGYRGKKTSAQQDLTDWTKQDWTTSDGKKAIRTDAAGEETTARYLPAEAWEQLTPEQRRATNAKKRRGAGQFVPNTQAAKKAAAKVRKSSKRDRQD